MPLPLVSLAQKTSYIFPALQKALPISLLQTTGMEGRQKKKKKKLKTKKETLRKGVERVGKGRCVLR